MIRIGLPTAFAIINSPSNNPWCFERSTTLVVVAILVCRGPDPGVIEDSFCRQTLGCFFDQQMIYQVLRICTDVSPFVFGKTKTSCETKAG
jgi:hypothetical protein